MSECNGKLNIICLICWGVITRKCECKVEHWCPCKYPNPFEVKEKKS